MAILDTVKKIIPYIKTATGYVLYRWSSQAVEMDDGTLLQDKIESMDSEIDGKANTSHTHTATQITGLTASRAMVSDGSGRPAVSNVTATELNCLDGATSNIQDQINTLNSNLIGLNGKITRIVYKHDTVTLNEHGMFNVRHICSDERLINVILLNEQYELRQMSTDSKAWYRVFNPWTGSSVSSGNYYIRVIYFE